MVDISAHTNSIYTRTRGKFCHFPHARRAEMGRLCHSAVGLRFWDLWEDHVHVNSTTHSGLHLFKSSSTLYNQTVTLTCTTFSQCQNSTLKTQECQGEQGKNTGSLQGIAECSEAKILRNQNFSRSLQGTAQHSEVKILRHQNCSKQNYTSFFITI